MQHEAQLTTDTESAYLAFGGPLVDDLLDGVLFLSIRHLGDCLVVTVEGSVVE